MGSAADTLPQADVGGHCRSSLGEERACRDKPSPQGSFSHQPTSNHNMMLSNIRDTSDPSKVGAERYAGPCRVPDTSCTLAHT